MLAGSGVVVMSDGVGSTAAMMRPEIAWLNWPGVTSTLLTCNVSVPVPGPLLNGMLVMVDGLQMILRPPWVVFATRPNKVPKNVWFATDGALNATSRLSVFPE